MKRALTIAGSDSGGGAGIQADLKTFSAHGVFGMSAITALTAQNTVGVQGVFEIPPEFVGRQIDSVVQDIGTDVVKTGMLSNAAIVAMVAAKITEYRLAPLVVDPVMVAKGGDPLLKPEARDSLIKLLLPLATVLTPNIPEAEVLCGFEIASLEDMRAAARVISALGPKAVVVKGGHFVDPEESRDILFDGKDFEEFFTPRISSKNTHGTGCTFASAIAASLALGLSVHEAVRNAKEYVTRIIQASVNLHLGRGFGPMNHGALLGRIPPCDDRDPPVLGTPYDGREL
jgi:hydroxymethylpyrimidine/phosphomethylpyrimidine kinase